MIVDENEIVPPQTFQVLKPHNSKSNVFRDLQFIFDFVQKTMALCLCKFVNDDDHFEGVLDINKFRNLRILEVQKIPIRQVIGIQQLRAQIQELICVRSLNHVKEIISDCGGDNSSGFIWNELKRVDFSYNNFEKMDSSFEFTPYIQVLNLSHNKIESVSAIKWLPNLKILNLSYNQLTHVPAFNNESYRRLQVLILNDNFIEDVSGLARMDSLVELDLSGNFLIDHSMLLPLCSLASLMVLNLWGNPIACHEKHRNATCRFLNKNAACDKFLLDGEILSRKEKSLAGAYQNHFPWFPSARTRCDSSRSTISVTSISSIKGKFFVFNI